MPLTISDLSFSAVTAVGRHAVLDEIHLSLHPGEVLGLIGGPGSGKTAFLEALAGIVRPTRGSVLMDDPSPGEMEDGITPLAALLERPEDMFVSGEVWREVELGLVLRGTPEQRRFGLIEEALTRVGLSPQRFRHRDPRTLSTGEQRRLALASVLVLRPRYLILDEPTAGLDAPGVDTVHHLIDDLKVTGMGMIILSREADFLLRVADRIYALKAGRIVAECPVSDSAGMLQCLAAAEVRLPDALAIWQVLRECGRIREDIPPDIKRMIQCLAPEGGIEG